MTDTQALAMLALRRVSGRIGVTAHAGAPIADEPEADLSDPAVLTGGDRVALGRVLRRAVERAWLTLEVLFAADAIGIRLGHAGKETLDAIFGNRCFDQLRDTPTPFRETIAQELHVARKSGLLVQGEIDIDDLLRRMSSLNRPSDSRAVQDLEWYALWQMAGDVARDGYRELRRLFEVRSAAGDSLLVGLVTSFIPFELELEGNPPRTELGLSILPDQHVRWLCEHSEPIEVLLNESHGSRRSDDTQEVVARVRQGQIFAQQGQYERAVIEFTAAIQSEAAPPAVFVYRGDALRHRGEYERAIADYTQTLRLEPKNLLARVNRGLVYRLTGRSELAVADLTEALRLDTRNVVALNGRGGAYADLGEYAQAIADHTQALRIDPSLAWAYQSRGDAYAGLEEYDRAIADYTQALRLNPHFPLAHANRGDAYRLAGDLDRAAADYTEALRLDPLNPRMFISRGDTYRKQKRFELAQADYSEAIRLDPTNPVGYLNRGIAYQLAGQYDQAVANFDQAELFDASNPEVFYQRALAHRHQESYRKAIEDLGRVIDLNPRDAVAYISRGTLYSIVKDFEPALADYSEAIRLDPTSAQARMERGRVWALLGQFDKALDDCAQAIRIDSNFVPALLIRGGVMIRQGDFDAALLEFNQAIRTNPRYAKAYNDRGVAHSKLGKLDEAIRDFSKAIELVPEDAQALSNRGNAFQRLHRHPEALRDFTEAVAIDAKYAAMYSLTRGLVEAGRGNFRQAIADYAVALAVDPKNRAAHVARLDARSKLESDFVVATETVEAPQQAPTPHGAPGSAALIDLGAAVAELEAEPQRPQAVEETQLVAARGAPNTQLALPPVAEETAQEAEYRAEQRKFEQMDRQRRLQALEEKAAEIRKRNELEEAKRNADTTKLNKKKREKIDPEERAELWKKRKKYAVILVGGLFVGYWLFQGIWAIIPRAKNPFHTYAATEIVGEYANDAARADDKFADQLIAVRGKLKVVEDKKTRVRIVTPRVFFDVPSPKGDFKIECVFEDAETIDAIKEDSEYLVVGRVDRYKPGKGIALKNANLLSAGKSSAARPGGAEFACAERIAVKTSSTFRAALAGCTIDAATIGRGQSLANRDRPGFAIGGESLESVLLRRQALCMSQRANSSPGSRRFV
jgi:tetratricopeptide (TPR) repeat protein